LWNKPLSEKTAGRRQGDDPVLGKTWEKRANHKIVRSNKQHISSHFLERRTKLDGQNQKTAQNPHF
jgi:hypothetical protein